MAATGTWCAALLVVVVLAAAAEGTRRPWVSTQDPRPHKGKGPCVKGPAACRKVCAEEEGAGGHCNREGVCICSGHYKTTRASTTAPDTTAPDTTPEPDGDRDAHGPTHHPASPEHTSTAPFATASPTGGTKLPPTPSPMTVTPARPGTKALPPTPSPSRPSPASATPTSSPTTRHRGRKASTRPSPSAPHSTTPAFKPTPAEFDEES